MTRERVTKEGVTEGLSDREEGTKGVTWKRVTETSTKVRVAKPFSLRGQ